MPKKFTNIPVEKDTRILYQKQGKLGGFDVCQELWSWDGIEAKSIIFSNEDISDLSDEELEQVVRTSPMVKEGSSMTLNSSDSGYTFCNFNFE